MIDRVAGQTARAAGVRAGELLEKAAECVPLDGRRPRLLNDPARALRVTAGHVDLFAVSIMTGASISRLASIRGCGSATLTSPFNPTQMTVPTGTALLASTS